MTDDELVEGWLDEVLAKLVDVGYAIEGYDESGKLCYAITDAGRLHLEQLLATKH